MEALGKITIATVGTKPKMITVLTDDQIKALDGGKWPLMRVMGTARSLKAAIDTNGNPVFGLVGQFLAINVQDAKEFTSGVLYLPGGLQEMIQDPLEAGLNAGDKNTAIEFAMDVYSVKATNKAGYSFQATLHGGAEQADPFAAVKSRIGAVALPALPDLGNDAAAKEAEAKAAQEAMSKDAAEKAAAEAAKET